MLASPRPQQQVDPRYGYERSNQLVLTANDYIILVMGTTGVGKSTFIHRLTGADTGIGKKLASDTVHISLYRHDLPDGRRLVMVDTPGFRDGQMSDAMVLTILSSWLAAAYDKGLVLAGILCLYRVTDRRWTMEHKRNLDLFRAIWGDSCLTNLFFVTTMWPEPVAVTQRQDAEIIAKDFETYWRPIIKKGAQVHRFDDTYESARQIILSLPALRCATSTSTQLPPSAQRILQIQVDLVDKNRRLDRTEAGRIVEGDIRSMTLYQKQIQKRDRKQLGKYQRGGDKEGEKLIKEMLAQQEESLSRWSVELRLLGQATWQSLADILTAIKVTLRIGDDTKSQI